MKQRSFLIPALLATSLAVASANAAIAITDWARVQGPDPLTIDNTDRANPVVGTGDPNSADDSGIWAGFTGGTLATGQTITLSGSVEIIGGDAAGDQFRFGLFDVNGQAGITGWLGYLASNSTGATTGSLRERNNPNSNAPVSSSGITSLQTATAGTAFTATVGIIYDFSLAYTRLADDSLDITWSLVRQGGGYSLTPETFNDATPHTHTFDRVAFLFGGSLNADQVNFSNVDVSIVPEPGAALLGSIGLLALLRRRRA